jgi:hypothetical protein
MPNDEKPRDLNEFPVANYRTVTMSRSTGQIDGQIDFFFRWCSIFNSNKSSSFENIHGISVHLASAARKGDDIRPESAATG